MQQTISTVVLCARDYTRPWYILRLLITTLPLYRCCITGYDSAGGSLPYTPKPKIDWAAAAAAMAAAATAAAAAAAAAGRVRVTPKGRTAQGGAAGASKASGAGKRRAGGKAAGAAIKKVR
jgi:hypothetical protein